MRKRFILPNFQLLPSKTFENPNWSLYGLKDAEGWPAMLLLASGKPVNEIVQNINELNDQIKIHKQPFEDLGTLSEKLLNFRIYPSNGSRLYVIDPFYKKLEVTELCYSGEFKMFFKYHKSFDLSNFRISILYYSHTGKQVYSYQPILQPPKNSDQEFLECEINDNRIKQSVVSAKVHLIHENKRIQTYFKKVEAKNGSFQITETPSLKLNKLQSKRNSLIKRIRER